VGVLWVIRAGACFFSQGGEADVDWLLIDESYPGVLWTLFRFFHFVAARCNSEKAALILGDPLASRAFFKGEALVSGRRAPGQCRQSTASETRGCVG
jgi:hypothetical protein